MQLQQYWIDKKSPRTRAFSSADVIKMTIFKSKINSLSHKLIYTPVDKQ